MRASAHAANWVPMGSASVGAAASAQARHWLHGFREVAPGSGAECQLCVVGLLE